MMGHLRWLYNQALELVKNETCKPELKNLRETCVNNTCYPEGHFIRTIDHDVRYEVVRELVRSYKSCFTRMKKRQITHFELSKRTKKQDQILTIQHKHWNHKRGWYKDNILDIKTQGFQQVPQNIEFAVKIQLTRLGEWYLLVPEKGVVCESQANDVVSLDPGVRTFQTCYNPSGELTEWGVKSNERISELYDRIRKLSKALKKSRLNRTKRKGIHESILRVYRKISRLVDDLHYKLVKWLVSNHRLILIPEFGTSRMVRGRLYSKTKREMSLLRHHEFRRRLEDKARWYKVEVRVVDESYTSMTCTGCGRLNERRTSKQLECAWCGLKVDRDVAGSRNILIKSLS